MTDFLLTGEKDIFLRFINSLRQKITSIAGLTDFFILEEGPHEPAIISSIETITDNTIILKTDEEPLPMSKRIKFTSVEPYWFPLKSSVGSD